MKQKDITIKGKKYQLLSEFRDEKEIREQFYELPKTMFYLDFKPWYEAGYWGDQYNPHCLLDNGRPVSNISVYHQKFMIDGEEKHLIQIGGVCTYEEYRNQGLSRCIMEEIIEEYKDQCDGIFLMANDSVLDFYPKFGFKESKEHQYVTYCKEVSQNEHVRKLDPENEDDCKLVMEKMKEVNAHIQLATVNQSELAMLYWKILKITEFYYIEELAVVAAMKCDENQVLIDNIYGNVPIDEVITALCNKENTKFILGFKPIELNTYEVEVFKEEDCTLFILNKELKSTFDTKQLKFPVISHT